jgi:glycosyltransferase involved in cell wall biosynthesis
MSQITHSPKITVIIPTRTRPDTLEKCLATVVIQDYDNLEIIVSDNFSCDSTEDIVRSFQDSRLKYLNTGSRISMSHNWEFALSHVSEGWVTIIGDDDGLLPSALNKVAEMIRMTKTLAIRSRTCSYAWPSLLGKEFGRISITLSSGYEIRDSKVWLSKVMSGYADYTVLPMLYNGGFVDFNVLEKIKKTTGSFYRSCAPDVYSGVAIANVLDDYLYSYEPLAINGASKHSTGTSSFSNTPNTGGSPREKFKSEENIPFHPDIPLCDDGNYPPSIDIIVYESYLQSYNLRLNRDNIHANQLEVILARTTKQHEKVVKEWGKIFALIHGLNYDIISKRAHLKRILLNLSLQKNRFSIILNSFSIGSPELPIKDVYEASLVINSIMQTRLSILTITQNLLSRAYGFLQKSSNSIKWDRIINLRKH